MEKVNAMDLKNISAVVTGGASGLGLASAKRLLAGGARVTIADLPTSAGAEVAASLGGAARFVAEKDGSPVSLETYVAVIQTNLVGSFNVLRLAAARMARNEPMPCGDRGACVLTASVAAYEGQIGQAPYASSKAGVVGMTIVAARDLAGKAIRVCTIAPGLFDTPLLARVPQPVREALGQSVPHPARLGMPDEFAQLALHILENSMLNGETIRLDGAIRMAPR